MRARSTSTAAVVATLLFVGAPPLAVLAQSDRETIEVKMVDFEFQPARISVHRGDTVRFLQAAPSPHNVEFRTAPPDARLSPEMLPVVSAQLRVGAGEPPPRMGPFLVGEGAVYEIVIGEALPPGSYEIVCTPHEPMGMKADLQVIATRTEKGEER